MELAAPPPALAPLAVLCNKKQLASVPENAPPPELAWLFTRIQFETTAFVEVQPTPPPFGALADVTFPLVSVKPDSRAPSHK